MNTFIGACDAAAAMIDAGAPFLTAVSDASDYYGYAFVDIQEELSARSAAKRHRYAVGPRDESPAVKVVESDHDFDTEFPPVETDTPAQRWAWSQVKEGELV